MPKRTFSSGRSRSSKVAMRETHRNNYRRAPPQLQPASAFDWQTASYFHRDSATVSNAQRTSLNRSSGSSLEESIWAPQSLPRSVAMASCVPVPSKPRTATLARLSASDESTNEYEAESYKREDDWLELSYTNMSIFEVGPCSVLLHACNCKGHWGKGVALQMKKLYPQHFAVYKEYCRTHSPEEMLGTGLLIGPSELSKTTRNRWATTHWIGFLFTNAATGSKGVNGPSKENKKRIVDATQSSMKDLLMRINSARLSGMNIDEIHMPMINSGSFRIPWVQTEDALQEVRVDKDFASPWKVYIHTFVPREMLY